VDGLDTGGIRRTAITGTLSWAVAEARNVVEDFTDNLSPSSDEVTDAMEEPDGCLPQ
jgi:hypothetical protein